MVDIRHEIENEMEMEAFKLVVGEIQDDIAYLRKLRLLKFGYICFQIPPYERPALSKGYLLPEGMHCHPQISEVVV